MEEIITIIVSVIASGGFWTWLQKRSEKKDIRTKLLMGLAHDRIMYLGSVHVERGQISQDELDDLHEYLYDPYLAQGGNGAAKRIMDAVDRLPVVRRDYRTPVNQS